MDRLKSSISKKITLAFFIVVILSLFITGISFSIMIRNYIVNQTKKNILEEGKNIADVLGTLKNAKDIDNEIQNKMKKFSVFSKNLSLNFAVLDSSNNIVYSQNNTSSIDISKINKLIIDKVKRTNKPATEIGKKNKEFIIAALPINNTKGIVSAVLVIYTPINGLNIITYSIFRILLLSFVISVIIVLIVAYIFAMKISEPINILKQKAEKISKRDFNVSKIVHTGDEFEELDDSFNNMAQKIKEYDESQKMLFQNMSHEIKTPLMSIQGYAEGIKDGIIDGQDMEKSLNIIITESQRLKKLIDEIIILTKLENMDEMYNFSKVCINEVVLNSIDKIRSLTLQKNIEIKITGYSNLYCICDTDRISQVIINIVGNAMRYAKSIILLNISAANNFVKIEIENDGPNLTKEENNNIFKRFYKGINGGQTGLGMAIAQAIILKHKGNILIKTSSLGGPKFEILLPSI